MSFEETTARVENAFRAMKAIGFSADKAEPVFLDLLKLYGTNWAYIEKDNYRVFADAMFQRDKAEAVEHSKKVMKKSEVRVKRLRQECLPPDMPELPVGGALGCLVKAVDESTAELEARYVGLLEKHYALQVEHHACPGFINILEVKVENLKAMVAEERKHVAVIGAEMSRKDKEIDELKKKVDELAVRWQNEYEARMKATKRTKKIAGVNEVPEKACTIVGDGRPVCFLDYMRAATVTADKRASVPDFIREGSERNQFAVDITERGQFAVDVLVEYNEEVQKLERRYADMGKRYQEMKDAHATCLSEIESIKTEKARLEKRAKDAETVALAKDKHVGKALEYMRATQARLNEVVAEASAARSQADKDDEP